MKNMKKKEKINVGPKNGTKNDTPTKVKKTTANLVLLRRKKNSRKPGAADTDSL